MGLPTVVFIVQSTSMNPSRSSPRRYWSIVLFLCEMMLVKLFLWPCVRCAVGMKINAAVFLIVGVDLDSLPCEASYSLMHHRLLVPCHLPMESQRDSHQIQVLQRLCFCLILYGWRCERCNSGSRFIHASARLPSSIWNLVIHFRRSVFPPLLFMNFMTRFRNTVCASSQSQVSMFSWSIEFFFHLEVSTVPCKVTFCILMLLTLYVTTIIYCIFKSKAGSLSIKSWRCLSGSLCHQNQGASMWLHLLPHCTGFIFVIGLLIKRAQSSQRPRYHWRVALTFCWSRATLCLFFSASGIVLAWSNNLYSLLGLHTQKIVDVLLLTVSAHAKTHTQTFPPREEWH